jgi:large subunit ribosomal protein L30
MSPAAKKTAATSEQSADTTYLLITQVKSSIGTKPKHRGTLRALGLRGVNKAHVLPDRPEVRGMIARVPHLVTVTNASAEQVEAQREVRKAALEARITRIGGATSAGGSD